MKESECDNGFGAILYCVVMEDSGEFEWKRPP
jgi:hypothetical protein